MEREHWAKVDQYVTDRLHTPDPVLDAALAASFAAGLPEIQVSPPLGKLLHIVAQVIGARRILEIGTLGGYSTIWLARGLSPGGKLITLELEPKHAEVASANIQRAGLSELVEVRIGPALESLAALQKENAGPFDLIFIDADKPTTPEYFSWAVKLSRVGTLIIVDNVVRKGAVADPSSEDASVQGVRRLHEVVGSEPRVSATTIQTVGGKGYDGLLIAYVVAEER
jgi:predicted O-methyltransferase YrrM